MRQSMPMYAVLSVSRDIPSAPAPLRLESFEEQLDPELVSLPDPPRRRRMLMLVLLVLAATAALAMIIVLRHDITYALRTPIPADLGDLSTANARAFETYDNRLVRGEATLRVANGVRYERLLSADTFRTLPIAGRRDVWVELRVRAGEEGGGEAPRQIVGRLVRIDGTDPRRHGLAGAIDRATHEPVASVAWLLIDGEYPSNARWALVLATAFVGFAAWHLAATARLIRKLRV